MKTKLFTFFLALSASVGTIVAETYSGSYGKTITWSLNTTTGTLTISGSGSMEEVYLNEESTYPWEPYYESVQKVVINEGITSVGEYAFNDCENLRSVTLPNSLDSICRQGFSNTALTSLAFPPNLHYVEPYTFVNCRKLKTLTLSDSLEIIPTNMCSNCTSLQQIVIPNGVKKIEIDAFANCTALTSVTLGTGIRTIRNDAFYNTGLELDSKNWKNNVFYVDKACIRAGDNFSGTATIKDGTTIIAEDAFISTNITSLTLPNSLLYINENAFQNCSKLASVTFGSSLLDIDDSAFENTAITQLQLPDALSRIGAFAFTNSKKLATVSLGSALQTIEDNAFYACPLLTAIVIPDNVVTIKDAAFEACPALTDVTIGKSVVDMDMWYSFNAKVVKRLTFNAIHVKNVSYLTYNYISPSALEVVTFGSEVEFIPEQLCYRAEKLTSVTLPTNLKEIDDHAFEGCKSLKKIVIPNKVTQIGSYAFADCTALTSLTIGKSVKTIDYTAFDGSSSIKTLVWNAKHSNDLTGSMFENLTKLTFGNAVEYIPAHLCDYASLLPSVTFPASVTEIGAFAFSSCSALKQVTIPQSITKLNNGAFMLCENMDTVTCESSTPPTMGTGVFSDIAENAMLRVPCGSLSAYRKTTWKNYFSRFEEYFPFNVTISSADETMGTAVMGDFDCSTGSVLIEANANIGFVFDAWSDGNTEASRTLIVTQDTSLVATFKVQTFHITFIDWDGTVLLSSEVNYNTLPAIPENPSRPATAQYTYSFKEWKPEIVAALADATYKAEYDSVLNEYLITFLNEDGSVLDSRLWAYGELPTCIEPIKENTEHFAYHFDGWNPEIVTVTCDAVYSPTFRAVPIHTLTFLDWNGDELGIIKVEQGTEAMTPETPIREGFVFTGWSRDLSSVTKDMYVIALYSLDVSTALKVHFLDAQDQLIQTSHITDAIPEAPIVAQKVFVGWQAVAGDIENGIIIRAVYQQDTPLSTIQQPAPNKNYRKIIQNGIVYILSNDKTYTITGQKVK